MLRGEVPDEQSRGLLTGVVLLRLAVLVWASVVLAIDVLGVTRVRPVPAIATLSGLAAWTSLLAWWTRARPRLLTGPAIVPLDVAIAAAVAAADHLVYRGAHPQSFGSAWPLGAVVTAGILRGPAGGVLAGAAVGSAGIVGTSVFHHEGLDGRWTASTGSLVLLTVAGVLAGVVTQALRRAEMTIARARAREEFARELHDGVLQTLAVVQRRSDDPDLVALAREQEIELRGHIGGTDAPPPLQRRTRSRTAAASFVASLRTAAATAERRTGVRCEVVVVDDPGPVGEEITRAMCAALVEGVTNADKHGGASHAVICVEQRDDGAVICTVTDDGSGFDQASAKEGVGISRSIRGRMSEVGGWVEIDARPGRGCQVLLGAPTPTGRGARRA